MKIPDTIIRFAVGALFIFSGLVKINDPIGTEIKMEEYFQVFADDFAGFFIHLAPMALELGTFLIILEVVLGVALFLNYRIDISAWVLLLLILFFTWLTFYSAYFNKVTDCGCFGDAIPLTPWQSFYKDVVLTVLIVYIFYRRKKFVPVLKERIGHIVIGSVAVITLFTGIYALRHLPYIDFRAYKVGDNIEQNMQPSEQPVFEYEFLKDGETIRSETYLTEADGYEYVNFRIKNAEEATPKITDYHIENDEIGDYTQQTFTGRKLFVIVHDVDKTNVRNYDEISELIRGLSEAESIAITASDPTKFEFFRHEVQLAIPYFFADAVVLKAMIRSNPGVMVLENGTVLGKWHYNDIPTAEKVRTLFQ